MEYIEIDSPPQEVVGFTFHDQNSMIDNDFFSFRGRNYGNNNENSELRHSKFVTHKGRKIQFEELKLN